MTVSEHGSAWIRWLRSRCRPRPSAMMPLITSPCEQIRYVALAPSTAFHSRTAATARCWVSSMDSPSGPGNRTALGCAWTTRHSGSLASFRSGFPVQSPYRHSPSRSSVRISRPWSTRAAAMMPAVSRQRSSGLLMIASSGRRASRSPTARACARPRSSSDIPGVQPASAWPVAAVRPCLTSRTVVTRATLAGLRTCAARRGRAGVPRAGRIPSGSVSLSSISLSSVSLSCFAHRGTPRTARYRM